MSISVVIVNWNAGAQLRECVASVLAHGGPQVERVVVVDNGSTDGSAEGLDGLPMVRVIRTGKNLGFARACNLGAGDIGSEFLLFLNPDARVFTDTIGAVLTFLAAPANERTGICGVQLVDERGVTRSCARFPSVASIFFGATGLDRLLPAFGHFMREWDHQDTRVVDQVSGAFFLVRRTLFEQLGGFDERFFVYFEEVDFSRRAARAGWRSIYFSGARAFHSGGGTTNQIKARRLFYLLRSRLLYAAKHFGWAGQLLTLVTTLGIEPVSRTVLGLSRGTFSDIRETFSAYGMLFCWLPEWWFKRATR